MAKLRRQSCLDLRGDLAGICRAGSRHRSLLPDPKVPVPHRPYLAGRLRRGGAAFAVIAALAACSANPVDAPPPTIVPAEAAASPPVTGNPAGSVVALDVSARGAVFDSATRTLAVLGSGTDGRSTLAVLAGTDPPRTVPLPAPATAITGDGHGTLYLSIRGGYLRFDVAHAETTRFDIEGGQDADFTAIARRADGRLVLGSADGAVYTLSSDTAVGAELAVFAHVDSVVTQGDIAVVLDRAQTSVTTIDPSGTKVGQALRAGEGATTIAVDPQGRVLVADTRGDSLLVFGTDPLILRQRYPVGDAPYGLAGSSELAWVSQTAANTVIGYDLATGIPVEKVRYRTVRQPDLLAFDDSSGTLYVVSGSGAGVQVISNAAASRP